MKKLAKRFDARVREGTSSATSPRDFAASTRPESPSIEPFHVVVETLAIRTTHEAHLFRVDTTEIPIAFVELAHRAEHVKDLVEQGCALGQRPERLVANAGHVVLKDQDEQLLLRLRVEEERADADIRLVGDLTSGGRIEALAREQALSCGADAAQLLLLVSLSAAERCAAGFDFMSVFIHDCDQL